MVKGVDSIGKTIYKSSHPSRTDTHSLVIKKSYYLNISINRFDQNNQTHYKIDYILVNNHQDLIPDKNIFRQKEKSSILTINQPYALIYIFNIPNVQLFNTLDVIDYKVRSTTFSIRPGSNENIFSKLLNTKKLYIKNNGSIQLVKPILIPIESIDKIMLDLFDQIKIE